MIFYQVAAFLAAFLLFQVQPMATKALLPVYGGTYQVWGAAVVFFQLALFGGYAYAHFVQRRFGVARYARWHLALLVLPFLVLPFDWEALAAMGGQGALVWGVLVGLGRHLLLPFFALATVSLLLQSWLAISDLAERVSPYRLYAASNLGSILGLLSYPLVVEPWLDLREQALVWWVLYGLLVAAHWRCLPPRSATVPAAELNPTPASPERALRAVVEGQPEGTAGASAGTLQRDEPGGDATAAPVKSRWWAWLGLSLSSNALLLAVTNLLTLKVAALPFLWVLPLTVFLLTFVQTFSRRGFRPAWVGRSVPLCLVLGFSLFLLDGFRLSVPTLVLIVLHLAILWVLCLACHGELVRLRPSAAGGGLTGFYLMLSLGGVLGGLLIAWVVPVVTVTILEYALGLGMAGVVLLVVGRLPGGAEGDQTQLAAEGVAGWRQPQFWRRLATALRWPALAAVLALGALQVLPALGAAESSPWLPMGWLVVVAAMGFLLLTGSREGPSHAARVVLAMGLAVLAEPMAERGGNLLRHRNYYGSYRVWETTERRILEHGRTVHGEQYRGGEDVFLPLSYYHPAAPLGSWLLGARQQMTSVGMVGLGSGALVAYFGPQQVVTIYELDPDNEWIARRYFTYLERAEAKGIDLRLQAGDGRRLLADGPPGQHDLLVVDAFSGDAVPVHLLTVEAFDVYFRALKPGGVVAIHVSNNIFDLEPVVFAAARAQGAVAVRKSGPLEKVEGASFSQWMLVSRDASRLPEWLAQGWTTTSISGREVRPWTDARSNPLGVMIW